MNKTALLGGALLLSLAANAFLGGYLLGHRTPDTEGLSRAQPLRQLMATVQQLPAEQRRDVRAVLRDQAPELRRRMGAIRERRQTIARALAAERVDRPALEAEFARQRDDSAALQASTQKLVLDIAERLPVEQRRRLLERPGLMP